ncbi:CWF19-like protein 1 [Galleria mellonella]|uniref:CWF19-like protein 1 n=1 Tax=Galleria mellonella TaxID=7137 RepID=A0A6J3BW92_GALME|nr:CWF19-like protein 1 [Galleria mellonella]XP_031765668.1 CWF19-like protein 1 [Galleria mellonella]
MSDKQKTLVCGDVNGNFNTLFSRVESIVKKSGPFDVLLCIGNFFGDDNSQLDAYRMRTRKVPVTTYVFGPSKSEHVQYYCEEGSEIVPNVIYMGKRGLFTTSSDIKIAYLTGLSRRELGKDIPMCVFEPSDCSAVRDACFRGQSEYRGIDVLITTLWPAGIQQDETQKVDIEEDRRSDLLAWLSIHLKPRYHFVPSTNKYYERQPYRNQSIHQDYRECATRFIALAPVGNKVKEKWIYACSLQPISKMRMTDLLQATTDETPCPYDPELLKQHQPGKVVKCTGNGQYFFNMDAADDDQGKRKRKGGDNPERKKKDIDPDSCWFCLSSPTVEKHLVITVGTHCYLALAKGPLTPQHVLILPIAHHQSVTRAPDEVVNEIKKFKCALRKFFASIDMAVVFFERNFHTTHMQIQCVPVSRACSSQVLEVFQDEAGINSIQMEVLPPYTEIEQVMLPGAPYFHAELPSGEQVYAKTKQHFPLQFGRDVLSSPPILNCEDKADWRQCQISREEEVSYVANFREQFRAFDFTADEDSDSD